MYIYCSTAIKLHFLGQEKRKITFPNLRNLGKRSRPTGGGILHAKQFTPERQVPAMPCYGINKTYSYFPIGITSVIIFLAILASGVAQQPYPQLFELQEQPPYSSNWNDSLGTQQQQTKHVQQPQQQRQIDLKPSFARRLPYNEVCGVVVCQSNAPLNELGTIVKEIENLQTDLKKYLAIPPADEKIELCIFTTEKAYLDFLKKEFPDAPMDRRALYVKKNGPGVVLVQKTDEFEIDVRHEMTHAILHASIRSVPIWLDEGLAKYFELPTTERPFGNPYLSKVKFNNSFGIVPSLARLEKLEYVDEMNNNEYRDSWAWVHFMIHNSRETHELLASYLQLLARQPETTTTSSQKSGQTSVPKLLPLLKTSVKNPNAEYKRHFKVWESPKKNL
ncbi:MAG: DUF1570 domain-containing protein [Thermoguttaceae bacterium]